MALTINSNPANIDCLAPYNVTTSLTEDASHVNLRVRAELYYEGVVKATVEKPKGLADFDFTDILKTLVPGLKLARNTGDEYQRGTIAATNLITGWTVESGTWDTFNASGASLEGIKAAAAAVYGQTNDIAVAAGDLIVVYATPYATTGVNNAYYIVAGDAEGQYIFSNNTYYIMALSTGNIKLLVGNANGELNFAGDFFAFKITTNRTTIGGLLAAYRVKFTEIYEDGSGVTTSGATALTKVRRFVSASKDSFTEYVMHDNVCHFASDTLTAKAVKYFTHTNWNREYFIAFFTEYAYITLSYRPNLTGGTERNFVCYEGWGVVILNTGEIMSTVTSAIDMWIEDYDTDAHISETLVVYVDSTDVAERTILEFDGASGGKEYLAFDGLKDIGFHTSRAYLSGENRNRKLISSKGFNRQRLETRFNNMANTQYLKDLLLSEQVKKIEASYVDTDVTVVSDSVKTANSEMFTNNIEIEYEN